MDIKLNARLSAYGKLPSPKSCNVDTVTHEEIDSLFDKTTLTQTPAQNSFPVVTSSSTVTHEEIDLLFKKG